MAVRTLVERTSKVMSLWMLLFLWLEIVPSYQSSISFSLMPFGLAPTSSVCLARFMSELLERRIQNTVQGVYWSCFWGYDLWMLHRFNHLTGMNVRSISNYFSTLLFLSLAYSSSSYLKFCSAVFGLWSKRIDQLKMPAVQSLFHFSWFERK